MSIIKNKFFISIIVLLITLSCKSQENVFYTELNKKLIEHINKTSSKNSVNKEKYLNNEIKFLLDSREVFLANLDFKSISEMYLIEILNPEIPSDIYAAYLKANSKVYLFKRGFDSKNQFEEMNLETFEEKYKMETCLFSEIDETSNTVNNQGDKGSFHFTVFLTKIKDEKNISTYISEKICI